MQGDFDVYLRPLCQSDAKTSWRWRNNPTVWKNTGSAPDRYITEEMEMDWMRKVLRDPSVKRYAICLRGSGQYIGNAYLSSISEGSAVEQIFIGVTELWGKGIGTKARAALCEIAREELGLSRIETHIRPRNIASIKSVLKLGFSEISRDEDWVRLEKYLN